MGSSAVSDSKESACNAGDLGLIPRLERSPGEGKGYPFQYSGLDKSMDCIIHGVAVGQDWETFTFTSLLSLKWKHGLKVETQKKAERKCPSAHPVGLMHQRGKGVQQTGWLDQGQLGAFNDKALQGRGWSHCGRGQFRFTRKHNS